MLIKNEIEVRDILLNQIRPGSERQCLLFSATYSREVENLHTGFYVNSPIKISIGEKTVKANPGVRQRFAVCHNEEQAREALRCTIEYCAKIRN
eukprot:UN28311